MERILITGISGYVGLSTAIALNQAGYYVVGIGRKKERPAVLPLDVCYVQCDVHEKDVLANLLKDEQITTVFHFASMKHVGQCEKEPGDCLHVNVGGTAAVLAAMEMADIKKIIFASTWAVYDLSQDVMLLTEKSNCSQRTVYSTSKYLSEKMIESCHRAGRLQQYHVLRYGNVIGDFFKTGVVQRSFVDIAIEACANNESVTLAGGDYDTSDGSVARDFVDIRDVVAANISALDHSGLGIYNIGSGTAMTLRQILGALAGAMKKESRVIVGDRRGDEPSLVALDSTKAKEELHWESRHTVADTIDTILK